MALCAVTKVLTLHPRPHAMTPTTVTTEDAEAALAAFVAPLADTGLQIRTLAHAWTLGDASFTVGKVAVRLCGKSGFTAGTLYAARGEQPARLELARIILEKHGVSHEQWTHWADEFADLSHHGFDASAKYPILALGDHITPAELARLVSGLRDLARITT